MPLSASPSESGSSALQQHNYSSHEHHFADDTCCLEGLPEADNLFSTPHKHLGLMDIHESFAHSLSLSDDKSLEHSSQISPASVLPHHELPMKAHEGGDPNDQVAEFQNLRHQHAQLLAFSHVLVEENNHRLVDRAELVSELMSANQRAYQAERTSATAVANAAQLQGEVLRLSDQMDELREDLQTQTSLADSQQEQLEAAHEQMTEQQRRNLAKMEKQGWEAADWKARALESTQKLAAANAQIAEQARIIVTQEQMYAKDITKLNAQLMHYSAMVGIQSFSPVDLGDDDDGDD